MTTSTGPDWAVINAALGTTYHIEKARAYVDEPMSPADDTLTRYELTRWYAERSGRAAVIIESLLGEIERLQS